MRVSAIRIGESKNNVLRNDRGCKENANRLSLLRFFGLQQSEELGPLRGASGHTVVPLPHTSGARYGC